MHFQKENRRRAQPSNVKLPRDTFDELAGAGGINRGVHEGGYDETGSLGTRRFGRKGLIMGLVLRARSPRD